MNRNRSLGIVAVATMVVASFAVAPARAIAQGTHLRIEGGSSPEVFTISSHHGYPALPITSLTALGARVEETEFGARALLLEDTLTFDIDSPIFTEGRRVGQLVGAVYTRADTIYLPAQLLTEWLPENRPDLVELRDGVLHLIPPRPEEPIQPMTTHRRSPAAASEDGAPEPRVVIIDPGHGGPDPGNLGRGGVREKDLTLTVSRQLAEVLRKRGGYEVHLTRTTDTAVALADRPRMANRWKANRPAALFISIHVNSFRSPSAAGFETFFLSEARTEDERRVAEMENSAIEYEDDPGDDSAFDDLDWIFNTLRNDFYIRASNDLAEVIQERFATFHPGPNRGVKQAGFRVLVGAFMPAALVELGFFSNPSEARLLTDTSFQKKIIDGLAGAIDEFFTSHEHLWSTEATTEVGVGSIGEGGR